MRNVRNFLIFPIKAAGFVFANSSSRPPSGVSIFALVETVEFRAACKGIIPMSLKINSSKIEYSVLGKSMRVKGREIKNCDESFPQKQDIKLIVTNDTEMLLCKSHSLGQTWFI